MHTLISVRNSRTIQIITSLVTHQMYLEVHKSSQLNNHQSQSARLTVGRARHTRDIDTGSTSSCGVSFYDFFFPISSEHRKHERPTGNAKQLPISWTTPACPQKSTRSSQISNLNSKKASHTHTSHSSQSSVLFTGDITQKGYEKRKAKLLEPYQSGTTLVRIIVATRALVGA